MKKIWTLVIALIVVTPFTFAQTMNVRGYVDVNVYGNRRHSNGNYQNGTIYQGGSVYQPGTVYQGGTGYQEGGCQGGNVYQNGTVYQSSPYYSQPSTSSQPAPVSYSLPVMTPNEFNYALQTISNQWFDSSKLAVAEQIASTHYLYAAQVTQIMQLFDFDSGKVSFAKFAYYHTMDPSNYYMVNNAFTFSSSAKDLNCYLMRQ